MKKIYFVFFIFLLGLAAYYFVSTQPEPPLAYWVQGQLILDLAEESNNIIVTSTSSDTVVLSGYVHKLSSKKQAVGLAQQVSQYKKIPFRVVDKIEVKAK